MCSTKCFCTTKCLAVLTLASLFAGCASPPATFVEGVDYVTIQCKVRDAHVQHVAHHPELRVDDALVERLDFALGSDDMEAARRVALWFVDAAHNLALTTSRDEIVQLDEEGLGELSALYFGGRPMSSADVIDEFRERTAVRVDGLRRQIVAADSPTDLREVLAPIRDELETPVRRQGKFGRMAPWIAFAPMSNAAINKIYANEIRENTDVPFAAATVYHLRDDGTLDAPFGDLLARYAPIIVQEATATDATYDPGIDEIGIVAAISPDAIEVRPHESAMYAYAREVCIAGCAHVQLIYTHWYSEHPALKPKDPEAGHIEGVTLRVTLGRDFQPAFFETLYNCGCYHRLYPTDRLEAMAAAEFGRPVTGKNWSIERAVEGKKDLIVLDPVRTVGVEDDARPVIRVRAGWHGIVDVGFDVEKHPGERHASKAIVLHRYAELERLPTDDGRITSMFYDNGLVKHAERREGVYFTPAGILSAGQPRQRGTQLIHWDDWDFDDTHLFPHALRLPSAF